MARAKTPRDTMSKQSSTRPGSSNVVALHPTGAQQAAPTTSPKSATITHEQIARRAHEIWVKRGRKQGEDRQNWLEAEAQLKAELARR